MISREATAINDLLRHCLITIILSKNVLLLITVAKCPSPNFVILN